MHIFFIQIRLTLPFAHNLKEKRMVVQSLKKRLTNTFNISVLETDDQNLWQSAVIGIVGLSSSRGNGDETIRQIIAWMDANNEGEAIVLEKTYL